MWPAGQGTPSHCAAFTATSGPSALDVLSRRRAALDDELAVSAVKREAVGLYEQVGAAEARRGELQAPQQ